MRVPVFIGLVIYKHSEYDFVDIGFGRYSWIRNIYSPALNIGFYIDKNKWLSAEKEKKLRQETLKSKINSTNDELDF